MIKKEVLGVLVLILMIGFVSAVEFDETALELKKTPIEINGEKRTNFTLEILDHEEGTIVKTIDDRTDGAGYYSYNYYAIVNSIDFKLIIKEGGQAVDTFEYGPYTAGSSIGFTFSLEENSPEETGTSADASNNDNSQTSQTSDAEPQSDSGVTGRAIDDSDSSSANLDFFYYLGAFILIAGAIALFILKRKGVLFKDNANKNTVVDPTESEVMPIVANKNDEVKDERISNLEEAEQRINQLKKELSQIKNKERIRHIEKHIKREQRELERLRED